MKGGNFIIIFIYFFKKPTFSYAWILQDILGIALCVSLSQDISFPNLKVHFISYFCDINKFLLPFRFPQLY